MELIEDNFHLWYIIATYIDVNRPRRPRVFRDHSNPMMQYSEEEFRMRMRLSKHDVIGVLHRIQPQLQFNAVRQGAVPPIHQLLIALRFYSTGSFQV